MAGQERGSQLGAGFAGQRQAGFSEMAGPANYGSMIPQVGFGAALKALQARERQDEAYDQTQPSKQFPDKYDKEHDFKPEEDHARLTSFSLGYGRKVAPRRRNLFVNFADRVAQVNGSAFRAVPHTQYAMNYLTQQESHDLTEGWLQRQTRKPATPKDEIRRLNGLAADINAFLQHEVQVEFGYEADLCERMPDLAATYMERRLDPDNLRWFEPEEALEDNDLSIEWASMYLPATFQVSSIGGSALSAVSVVLEDRDGKLAHGRNRFVDALGDRFGMNIDHVATDFQPEIDILTTVGGRSLAGMQWQIPASPHAWRLDVPKAYEMPNSRPSRT